MVLNKTFGIMRVVGDEVRKCFDCILIVATGDPQNVKRKADHASMIMKQSSGLWSIYLNKLPETCRSEALLNQSWTLFCLSFINSDSHTILFCFSLFLFFILTLFIQMCLFIISFSYTFCLDAFYVLCEALWIVIVTQQLQTFSFCCKPAGAEDVKTSNV